MTITTRILLDVNKNTMVVTEYVTDDVNLLDAIGQQFDYNNEDSEDKVDFEIDLLDSGLKILRVFSNTYTIEEL